MEKKHYLLIILFVLFFLYIMTQKEGFDISDLAHIETEDLNSKPISYRIINENGVELISTAFTLTNCNHEDIKRSKGKQPTKSTSWTLKQISPGIYVFEKIGGGECLYLDKHNEFKSFLSSDCKHTTLCGTDLIDGIDENTERTYFRIVKTKQSNKYHIVSVTGNRYLCINSKGVQSKTSKDNDCLFRFEKI